MIFIETRLGKTPSKVKTPQLTKFGGDKKYAGSIFRPKERKAGEEKRLFPLFFFAAGV
jgi:hypothetical protein